MLFVGYLVNNRKKSSTIKSYISAIKSVLRENNIKINEDKYLLSSLTKACKYKNDYVKTRLPIHKKLLNAILAQTKAHFKGLGQIYLSKLYTAMFAAGYYGLLRISELTSDVHNHPILAKDIQVGTNKKKLLFILRSSKTHWKDSKPQIVKINSTTTKNGTTNKYCPFELINDYTSTRPRRQTNKEPLFVFKDRTPVSPNHFRKTLKLMLDKLNINSKLYGSHSLRIGRSSDLLKLGISVETIKKLGRWKSNAVYAYLR